MLILTGPEKVDLIFTEPHAVLPARQVTAATMPGIDDHFWDWMLWLTAKLVPGFAIHGWVTTFLASLLLAAVGMLWKAVTK